LRKSKVRANRMIVTANQNDVIETLLVRRPAMTVVLPFQPCMTVFVGWRKLGHSQHPVYFAIFRVARI
jgi:hypothetical protein